MHPPVDGWPPRAETTRLPPRGRQRAAPGDRRGATGTPAPSSPSSPRPARGQPEADQGGGGPASPPRGPRHQGGEATTVARCAARRVPPVGRPLTPAVPAAGWQPCAGTQGRTVDRGEKAAPKNAV